MTGRGLLSALLCALISTSTWAQGPHLNTAPLLPTGFDTYTIAEDSYEYTYGVGQTASGTDQALTLRVFLPDGVPASTPLPAIIFVNTGSFSVTDSDDTEINRERMEHYTALGAIAVLVKTQIQQDNPRASGGAARGATTAFGLSVDAIIENTPLALQYVRSNPDRANWTVEPNWVFFGGGSSSGIATMGAVIRHYPQDFYIPGMVNWITSFGADNALLGLDYVDEVRTELGLTEDDYTDGMPPMLHFSMGYDDVLSETTVPTLQSLLNARITSKAGNDGKSVVQLWPNDPPAFAAGSNHVLMEQWDESTLTGATTVEEATYLYVIDVLADVPKLSGTLRLE